MTFQLSASVAVNGFRLSAPRTATRRLPPYRPDASPWVARAGIADDRRSTRTRPRTASSAITVRTGNKIRPTEAVVTPCGTHETALEVVAVLPAASVASTKIT